jgi:Domain of unknown function (DUF4394)/PEP-CTERM motif
VVKKILVGLMAAAAIIAPAHAVKLYGVTETNHLISFDSATPGTVASDVAITGVTGSSILALDIRVRNGLMYALTDDFKIFTVNKATGAASLFANVAISGTQFAFDFNPTNANLRIVSNNDTNYVYNFTTNALIPGPNVAYGAGPLFGAAKDITGAAYLFNDNNLGTGTTLYVLDSLNDVLSTLNTATGTLTKVGDLGVNVGGRGSFDIATRGLTNAAFVANSGKLYSANLTTGALSLIGNTSETLFGLTAGVPEPAAWGLMIVGFGVVGASARRRRSTQVVTA